LGTVIFFIKIFYPYKPLLIDTRAGLGHLRYTIHDLCVAGHALIPGVLGGVGTFFIFYGVVWGLLGLKTMMKSELGMSAATWRAAGDV